MSVEDDVNRTNEEIIRQFQKEVEAENSEKLPSKEIAEFMAVRNSRLEDWMADALLHGMTLDTPEKPVIQAIVSMLISALLTILIGVNADKESFMRTFSHAWDLKKKLEKSKKKGEPRQSKIVCVNADDDDANDKDAEILPKATKVEAISADDDAEIHELLKKLTPNRFI